MQTSVLYEDDRDWDKNINWRWLPSVTYCITNLLEDSKYQTTAHVKQLNDMEDDSTDEDSGLEEVKLEPRIVEHKSKEKL